MTVTIDGAKLTIDGVVRVARPSANGRYEKAALSPKARERIAATRAFIDEVARLAGLSPDRALAEAHAHSPWYARSVDANYLTGKRVFIFGDTTQAVAAALNTARHARAEGGLLPHIPHAPRVPRVPKAPAPMKMHTGPIHSAVAGRTDHLPTHVPSGSYVIPADIVSSMGEGNTMAGFKNIRRMFSGEMDAANAFVDVQAGSGGTEAQEIGRASCRERV